MNKIKNLLLGSAASLVLVAGVSQAEMRIGIDPAPYLPFSAESASGNLEGWEIEIAEAICAAMNEDCVWVKTAWDGLIPALTSNKIDAIINSMSITEERMKTIDFSNKYYNTPAVIVAPKESNISADAASVNGMIVGVQVATTHANYVEAHMDSATVKSYQNFDEHNQDLFAGRLDAVVGDSMAMQPFLTSAEGQCCEIKGDLHDISVFGPGVGVGLRKGSDLTAKINAAIDQIRTDGTFDKISAPYFNFDIYGG
ncbi:MAG: polar amino acid transport system substrate-binding protein [Oceanospirillaceae bacterium]|jgi:polar amino acid transport system substrate-binding protein